jgi:UDP:flavonoid glycosyltransferase YjiC (YdhE family)
VTSTTNSLQNSFVFPKMMKNNNNNTFYSHHQSSSSTAITTRPASTISFFSSTSIQPQQQDVQKFPNSSSTNKQNVSYVPPFLRRDNQNRKQNQNDDKDCFVESWM